MHFLPLFQVCESEHKNRFLSSVIMLGFLTGSLLGGRISDRIGRTSAALLGLGIIVPSVALGGFVKVGSLSQSSLVDGRKIEDI